MELEGDGVADLLAGGDGEVWVMLGPAMFRLSCALIWDWLMVVSWFREIIPLGLFMLMMDFITMAGLVGYWRRWPGPTFCEEKEKSTCLENNHHMMFHWPLLSVSWNSFLQLEDTQNETLLPCVPSTRSCISSPERKSGHCGLLCDRSHVTMSWVLNVSMAMINYLDTRGAYFISQ